MTSVTLISVMEILGEWKAACGHPHNGTVFSNEEDVLWMLNEGRLTQHSTYCMKPQKRSSRRGKTTHSGGKSEQGCLADEWNRHEGEVTSGCSSNLWTEPLSRNKKHQKGQMPDISGTESNGLEKDLPLFQSQM